MQGSLGPVLCVKARVTSKFKFSCFREMGDSGTPGSQKLESPRLWTELSGDELELNF